WNYTEPDKQVIINDGSQLSIYTKKDKQMLVIPADELNSDITYAFFAGHKNLLDDFKAEPPEKRFIFSTASSSLQSVQLVPRTPHPQVKSIHLWFDGSALIHHLIIEDHFDSVTELSFSNIVLNGIAANDPKQLQKILDLALPPGTEIITQ
ncbi:MAG: hypothetical protein GQ559_06815, partial [Desulfobulbaceae bacterium]|nr:hypothetical protein [Desulfobulbaceae bacterium]